MKTTHRIYEVSESGLLRRPIRSVNHRWESRFEDGTVEELKEQIIQQKHYYEVTFLPITKLRYSE